jgi:hypothetical protein
MAAQMDVGNQETMLASAPTLCAMVERCSVLRETKYEEYPA